MLIYYVIISIIILSFLMAFLFKKSFVISAAAALFLIFFVETLYVLFGNSINEFIFVVVRPDPLSFFVSLFSHANAAHIVMNVLVLILIGIPLEERDGRLKVAVYYLFGGILGHILFYFSSLNNKYAGIIGASGCVFGLMGAFLSRYPNDEISFFLGFVFMRKVKVKYAITLLVIIEVLAMFLLQNDLVAHVAHLGGFIAGVVLGKAMPYTTNSERNLDFTSLYELVENYSERKIVERIIREDDPYIRKMLLENFLEKKCRKYKIGRRYIICDGKKYYFNRYRFK